MTGKFMRGAAIGVAAIWWTWAPAAGGAPPGRAGRPNVVFILADDLGYGDLGCYGQGRIKTPAIDRLAAQGRRFTQCYAGGTVCAPSRCSLMTGLHNGHARVRGNANVPLRPEDVTVAEVLKGAGYATGVVGKWGLGQPGTSGVPNRQGFDEWFGFLDQVKAHDYYPETLWKDEAIYRLEGNQGSGGVATARAQYAPDLFVREAVDFLDRHKDGPFFLYLATTLPHANNERGKAEGDGMEVPDLGPYANQPWPGPQKGHAAMITRLDDGVGRVLRKLDELGIADDTIVFFASDNGPHKEGGADPAFFGSSGPLRGYKRALYEGGIRVPMVVRWPGHVPPGTTRDDPWAFWDVLPTLAELAGVASPAGLDGVSQVGAIVGDVGANRDRFLYWEFHEGGSKQAARLGRWKAVRPALGIPLELYDLATDPGEAVDLAGQHPEVVARFEAYLRSARTESADFPLLPTPGSGAKK